MICSPEKDAGQVSFLCSRRRKSSEKLEFSPLREWALEPSLAPKQSSFSIRVHCLSIIWVSVPQKALPKHREMFLLASHQWVVWRGGRLKFIPAWPLPRFVLSSRGNTSLSLEFCICVWQSARIPCHDPTYHLCQVRLEALDSVKADTKISFCVTRDSTEWKETRSFCSLREANP